MLMSLLSRHGLMGWGIETTHQDWVGRDYTRTTIKLKENENNVLT